MFDEFRQLVKSDAKNRNLTYAALAALTGLEESTIKCFMCGANDSRRVAEKIADALNKKLVYSNGHYTLADEYTDFAQTAAEQGVEPNDISLAVSAIKRMREDAKTRKEEPHNDNP